MSTLFRDVTPASVITIASVFNFSNEEKKRREDMILNKDFFYDRHLRHVDLINTDVDPVQVNITAPIVKKKVSLLYSRPLIREFDGPSGSVSKLEEIYKDIRIDRFLRNVDLLAELTGTSLIFVGIDEGKIVLKLYDASEFSVVESEDDYTIPDAISIISRVMRISGNDKNPSVELHLKTEIWTEKFITTYIDDARTGSVSNEFDFLPFVPFLGEAVWGQYLGHAPATSVAQLNKTYNQQLTNLGYAIKMQSATPIVITGFESGEGFQVNAGKAISLPMGATATTLNLNPKITDALEVVNMLEEKTFETSSIPKVSVVGDAQAESARELMVKWEPLLQVFKDKALRYETYELNLANMILKVLGMETIKDINVSYPEEGILPVSSETEELKQEIALGLTTPVDELLKRDPSLSEEDAEAQIRANIDFNEQIKPIESIVPDEGTQEEEEK